MGPAHFGWVSCSQERYDNFASSQCDPSLGLCLEWAVPGLLYLKLYLLNSFRTTSAHLGKMWTAALSLASLVFGARLAAAEPAWAFELQNNTSGILALEAIVVSPTLVVWFDRASDDPLQINNHSAWGAIWDIESSTVQPLNLITDSFCGSGALLSNGTMVSSYTF